MHTVILAQNILQIGPHLGPQALSFAKWLLIAGVAIWAAILYGIGSEMKALKKILVGFVIIGLVLNASGLGQDSGDTISSVRGSTR